MAKKWTLVQHSGYGYAGKEGFARAVELRQVGTLAEQRKVEKAGGVLFDSWADADDAEQLVNDPPGSTGLYPQARGTFAAVQVDGLAVYIPVRQVVG